MRSPKPTILDATALIDFCCLQEWAWLQDYYSPLYISQELLDSDQLESSTRQTAHTYLKPLTLCNEEMFAIFSEFRRTSSLLSIADCSTLAIAHHQLLVCASDDGLVVETCKKFSIPYTRTLRLLSEMVQTRHKTKQEVITMANTLIKQRGKYISNQVLEDWRIDLEKY